METQPDNKPKTDELQPGDLLTVAEVAAYLRLSRRTTWRWCQNGKLPAQKIGHQWRISKSALNAHLNQRSQSDL